MKPEGSRGAWTTSRLPSQWGTCPFSFFSDPITYNSCEPIRETQAAPTDAFTELQVLSVDAWTTTWDDLICTSVFYLFSEKTALSKHSITFQKIEFPAPLHRIQIYSNMRSAVPGRFQPVTSVVTKTWHHLDDSTAIVSFNLNPVTAPSTVQLMQFGSQIRLQQVFKYVIKSTGGKLCSHSTKELDDK